MRAPALAIAAVAALSGACASMRPLTQVDREQATRAAQEKPKGTVLTEGEISRLDLDSTYICENRAQVGSHIPRLQCRSLRRVERERAEAASYAFDGDGWIPGELPPRTIQEKNLMATNGSTKVQGERPPQAQDAASADQDPRFPPL